MVQLPITSTHLVRKMDFFLERPFFKVYTSLDYLALGIPREHESDIETKATWANFSRGPGLHAA